MDSKDEVIRDLLTRTSSTTLTNLAGHSAEHNEVHLSNEKEVEIYSYILGNALKNENSEKFIEVYESIPSHYSQELVQFKISSRSSGKVI